MHRTELDDDGRRLDRAGRLALGPRYRSLRRRIGGIEQAGASKTYSRVALAVPRTSSQIECVVNTPDTAWEEYLRWNRAVADLWFSTEIGHQPAYIDVDRDVLQAAAAETQDDPIEMLAQVVAPTLFSAHGAPLSEHSKRLQAWRRRLGRARQSRSLDLEPPPVTALLGAFTVAAYQMGPRAASRRTPTFRASSTISTVPEESAARQQRLSDATRRTSGALSTSTWSTSRVSADSRPHSPSASATSGSLSPRRWSAPRIGCGCQDSSERSGSRRVPRSPRRPRAAAGCVDRSAIRRP